VSVVASAGNDATSRPSYPAAFAPVGGLGTDRTTVPLVAVGALNPDGTVALFSNDGEWVRFWRPGVSLISTMPTTFDGSAEATSVLVGERGEIRAGLDPDDFTAGFAVWSGTSFAAPVLAGQVAAGLLDRMAAAPEGRAPDQADAVAWAREVLESAPTLELRP
jgi:subtilisin family serine protease